MICIETSTCLVYKRVKSLLKKSLVYGCIKRVNNKKK